MIERLPVGIEECRFINLTSDEGYSKSHFQAIIPPKRRRNCYRIDEEQMNVEITRGRSDIYDILTHLTFIFIESHKIRNRVLLDDAGEVSRDWQKLELAVSQKKKLTQIEKEKAEERMKLLNPKEGGGLVEKAIQWRMRPDKIKGYLEEGMSMDEIYEIL